MSLIRLKASWKEDDGIFRDLEILSGQTYFDLHLCLKKEFQLPADMEASFFTCDHHWKREREISSTVEKNIRDAAALSMKKTPVGALISDPHQKLLYVCVHPKAWIFEMELITMEHEPMRIDLYPRCVRGEGISPALLGVIPTQKDSVVEIEERYDLNSNEDGYGEDGEESQSESEEENAFGDEFSSAEDI
ncbi:MAG TPA: hypothetical protein PLP34_01440 [Chitinophagaceae bacterium]|nr:hypothetical protein [Chitinophagaceae bacterium]